MRIGVDIRSLLEPYPSGISEYTRHIISHLARLDGEHEFVLFANAAMPIPGWIRDTFESPRVTIVETHWPNKLFNAALALCSYPHLDRLVGRVDAFFFPNLMFGAVSRQTRMVITVHDLSFQYPGFYRRWGRWWHRLVRPARLYRRADHIIAVSESTKRDLIQQYSVPESKITVIAHGIDPAPYAASSLAADDSFRQRYHLDRPYLLFVGTLSERKNTAAIIDSWRQWRQGRGHDHDLIMAGHVPGRRKQHTDSGLHYLGYVAEAEKPALYQNATALVYPSFHEGFGLPILEAFAAETPVITSHATALTEVGDTAVVAVDPYNRNELIMAFDQITRDQSLRQLLTKRGTERLTHYTWPAAARQTLGVITNS